MMHKQGGCGCGKPKPCPDGSCPHKRHALPTRLAPFYVWATKYTPVIPKFYWDVESQEERIKHIVLELDRLRAYINYVFCEVEKLIQELEEALANAQEMVEQLSQMLAEATQLLEQLRSTISDLEQRMQRLEQQFTAVQQQAQQAAQQAEQAQQTAQQAQQQAEQAQADVQQAKQDAQQAKQDAQQAEQQAQQAEQTAQQAQQAAQQANTKADAAQQQAQQAQQTAQQARDEVASKVDTATYDEGQAQQNEAIAAAQSAADAARADLTALTTRVTDLETCCNQVRGRLDELERWRQELEDRIAPLFIDPENPVVAIQGVEMAGQISSGPIGPQTSARYASTIAFTIPMNGIQGNSINIESLELLGRCGSWLRYVDNGGTEHVFSDYVQLIRNNQPAIPEIVGWSWWITPYIGINIRLMFNQSLTKRVWHPDNTNTNETIINATPVAYQVKIQGIVS